MYRATTRGIEVSVVPRYLAERSAPERGNWFWAYTVSIINRSPEAVQLLARYWRITDANGRVEEVRGTGVIGQQPEIAPGETYEYTSGCPLPTSSGFMVGHYRMISESGLRFEVEIPAFSLDAPSDKRVLN